MVTMTRTSNSDCHSMLISLLHPGFKSREEILTHIRLNILREIEKTKKPLEVHAKECSQDEQEQELALLQLKGEVPLTFSVYNHFEAVLGTSFLPYNPQIPDSTYHEYRKRLFHTDSTGSVEKAFVRSYLEEKLFIE